MARVLLTKPGDSFTITGEDAVLYAQWSKNVPAQIEVPSDANGGTGTNETAAHQLIHRNR